jgi:hypothetical protein
MRSLALAFLDTLHPPVPARVARWVPRFMLASPAERAWFDEMRSRLR